jgi:hypothetical protein
MRNSPSGDTVPNVESVLRTAEMGLNQELMERNEPLIGGGYAIFIRGSAELGLRQGCGDPGFARACNRMVRARLRQVECGLSLGANAFGLGAMVRRQRWFGAAWVRMIGRGCCGHRSHTIPDWTDKQERREEQYELESELGGHSGFFQTGSLQAMRQMEPLL